VPPPSGSLLIELLRGEERPVGSVQVVVATLRAADQSPLSGQPITLIVEGAHAQRHTPRHMMAGLPIFW